MIEYEPEKRIGITEIKIQIQALNWKRLYPKPFSGKITFDRKKLLGQGGFAAVYEGTYESDRVAVKRIPVYFLNTTLERGIGLQPTLNHENVLKILAIEEDEDFR